MSDKSPNFAAFISYAKADQTKAQEIAASLEEPGFKCWIAPRDVRPGHSYGDEIIRGIEGSRAFILVLSAASNESRFVAREIERAISKKKLIFTIRVEAVEPSPSLELFISGTQWIDAFSGRLGPHIEVLATLLPAEEGQEPATVSVAGVSPASHALRWRSPWVLGAAVLLAALGGLLWNFHRQEAVPETSQSKSSEIEPTVVTVPNPEVPTKYKPGDTLKDCDGCPEMVVIPPGEFIMGSPPEEKPEGLDGSSTEWEGPRHSVQIPSAFAIGKYEVTKDQFAAFINSSGYEGGAKCSEKIELPNPPEQTGHYFRNVGFPQAGNEPAVCISWSDARAYAAWLSKQTGKQYRLPSEAEWEYAARAGSLSRLVSATSQDELCKYANVNDLSYKGSGRQLESGSWTHANCSDGYVYTSPVGTFAPNSWGIYDMVGNASEWVEDCFHINYLHAPRDGSAWTGCSAVAGPMRRGGSFESWVQDARPAFRGALNGEYPQTDSGFRVARTLGQ